MLMMDPMIFHRGNDCLMERLVDFCVRRFFYTKSAATIIKLL